jgi:Trypsin-like peptidase domain
LGYEILLCDRASFNWNINYFCANRGDLLIYNKLQIFFSKKQTPAKIGNSDEASEGSTAYVAGFPQATPAISNSIYLFTEGKIAANASQPLQDGYALVYSNNTLPGMSGGPVLNENGELIGIHGKGDLFIGESQASSINPEILVKTGFNLGIPINSSLIILSGNQGKVTTDLAVQGNGNVAEQRRNSNQSFGVIGILFGVVVNC